ncbi:hypothetical protein TraAM80_09855 [Trypanosoma rangeli]|uniref:Uncharacterized protein n=1 Tax=Trypanosoma rangeli TaxID=5698 RepID=A0A422MT25_TRYRA|nr:uncharacterized protein TraAM80_09855 [Trypanosoma rangeli]RNE96343.1 hypothetical protein TraAM80_09855 [Trypanosoma rangeli]|eukprot:RNE96343.1 hypothetical protein TraAM80_09855 [Trypanosoma rangeli]
MVPDPTAFAPPCWSWWRSLSPLNLPIPLLLCCLLNWVLLPVLGLVHSIPGVLDPQTQKPSLPPAEFRVGHNVFCSTPRLAPPPPPIEEHKPMWKSFSTPLM